MCVWKIIKTAMKKSRWTICAAQDDFLFPVGLWDILIILKKNAIRT